MDFTKFMHDKGSPPPSYPSLNVGPNLCLTDSLVSRSHDTHCIEIETGAILALHSLHATALRQMDPHQNHLITKAHRAPQRGPIRFKVDMEVPLSFITSFGHGLQTC